MLKVRKYFLAILQNKHRYRPYGRYRCLGVLRVGVYLIYYGEIYIIVPTRCIIRQIIEIYKRKIIGRFAFSLFLGQTNMGYAHIHNIFINGLFYNQQN